MNNSSEMMPSNLSTVAGDILARSTTALLNA
nr:MAG TPA: hypothetical protein [Caudoviricetes sp.]